MTVRKWHLFGLVILSSCAAAANADQNELGVTFDLTYLSKWLSKGVEAYGQQGAIFETIDLDFWGTGFGASVVHRSATSNYADKERFDYMANYRSVLFEDTPYATKYKVNWAYEHYPGLARQKANTTNEWTFSFQWPELVGGGVVPRYTAYYEYPAGSGYRFNYITGWVHLFGLDYYADVSSLPQPLCLSSEVAYTDGLGGASHDWSYATFGVSTQFKISDNLTFAPGLYYQISTDDSVSSRHDITYARLSLKYRF